MFILIGKVHFGYLEGGFLIFHMVNLIDNYRRGEGEGANEINGILPKYLLALIFLKQSTTYRSKSEMLSYALSLAATVLAKPP